jgi:hypothetical protein
MTQRGKSSAQSVNRTPRFRSSIPARARARVAHQHPSGAPERVEYLVGRSIVGYRLFDTDGELLLDCGVCRRKRHGREYRLDLPGKLLSATGYRNGLEHGLARQWSEDGRLIGTYLMRNGTGVDLWWQETRTKPWRPYLAEVHFMLNGRRHGFEWWLNEDQLSVHQEHHWWHDEPHGIEREWNNKGSLRPGFPKFYVRGSRVSRQAYQRQQSHDPSLPAYRAEDDRPQRIFPPVIDRRLAFGTATSRRRRQVGASPRRSE